jgi:hypothetical protein
MTDVVTGPSRFLPRPVDRLARALWDDLSFYGRRLSPLVQPSLAREVNARLESLQRPWLARRRARLGDGSIAEYVGNDAVLRDKLFSAFVATGGSDAGRVLRFGLRSDYTTIANIVWIEIPSAEARDWAAAGHLILPRWIDFEVDLRRPENELWNARKRESVRRIERLKLEPELLGAEALDEFYEAFYVPTTRARHGAGAFLRRRRYVKNVLASGKVLFVLRDGERIAALVLVPRLGKTRVVDAWMFGARGGVYDATALEREAAFLFAIRWARDTFGAERFGLTAAPPLLHDGLLRYKKRWGAEALPNDRHGFSIALRVNEPGAELLTAMAQEPLICWSWRSAAPRLCALLSPVGTGASRVAPVPFGIDAFEFDGKDTAKAARQLAPP